LRTKGWQISEKTNAALCGQHRTRSLEESPLPTGSRTAPRTRAMNELIGNGGTMPIAVFREKVHPSVVNYLLAQRYIEIDETHARMVGFSQG